MTPKTSLKIYELEQKAAPISSLNFIYGLDKLIQEVTGSSLYFALKLGNGSQTATISDSHDFLVDGQQGDDVLTFTNCSRGTILGGADNDIITVSNHINSQGPIHDPFGPSVVPQNDLLIDGGTGNDTISLSYLSHFSVLGQSGNDIITSFQVQHAVYDGGAGNDTLSFTGSQSLSASGGNGSDIISVAYFKNGSLFGNAHNDQISTHATLNSLIDGGAGNDILNLQGNSYASTYVGGLGNDVVNIEGPIGETYISGDQGADTFNINADYVDGNVSIDGGIGKDVLNLKGNNFTYTFETAQDGSTVIQVTSNTYYHTVINYSNFETINVNGVKVISSLHT